MKKCKIQIMNRFILILLGILSLSQAFALTIIDKARRDEHSDWGINVQLYVPNNTAMNNLNTPGSCENNTSGWIMTTSIYSTGDQNIGGNQFSTGISGDRPLQYVCVRFSDWRAGHDNVWFTNPIKDVPECIFTVQEISYPDNKSTPPKATATPECGFAGAPVE